MPQSTCQRWTWRNVPRENGRVAIEIICGDLFDSQAPAVLINADVRVRANALGGANLAAKFRQRWPEAWEDVEATLFSALERTSARDVALGEVFLVELEDDDCPFSHALIANSLPHEGGSDDRSRAVIRAVEQAVLLARASSLDLLAVPLMVGGWRLTPNAAFEAMVTGYKNAIARTRPSTLGVSLMLYNLDAVLCKRLQVSLRR